MKFHWLLSGFIGVFLFCSPARAGKILDWEFAEQDNNLTFTTDEGVQPKAQLLSNPTRLVIDLPGTALGRETVKENYQGAVRGFRIGQPEPDMSRIVVEYAPGYTIEPGQVKFEEDSATEWKVEMPEPKVDRFNTASRDDDEPIELELPEVELAEVETPDSLPGLETTSAAADDVAIANPHIRATKNGFFIDIDGNRQIKIDSERDGDRIDFFLSGITLPEDLVDRTVDLNQYGVAEIEFEQVSDDEAVMSMEVEAGSPDWLATFSRIRGLLLVPRGKLPTSTTVANTPDPIETNETENLSEPENLDLSTESTAISLIKEIELRDDDTKLLVNGDTELSAVASRQSNGIYQITIDNAELAEDFKGPELEAGSPISQLKVRQEDSQVVVEITTRLRYRLGQLDAQNKAIALPIEVGAAPLPQNEAPLLPPGFDKAPKQTTVADIPPIPASDRPRIIIDPGHGGDDPGTIGIGGFREKDLVLPISLDVAEILRKQGIEVIMTRDSDRFISLEGRTDMSNDLNADLFVSIHANAINLSRPDVNGLETYYYKSGRRLAEVVHWSILNGVNIDNRGIRRARFFVLRHSIAPAVLVEVGFLTGAVDSSRLKDPNHRRQMAESIARGVIEYIKQNNI